MTWGGGGAWGGGDPWGGAVPGGAAPPTLIAVDPGVADVLGGTLATFYGTSFYDPALIEIVDGGGATVGTAYYQHAKLDLRYGKIIAGLPALPVGVYGVKVTTPAGTSPVLRGVLTYKVFADEGKVLRTRRRYAQIWATGERISV